MNPTSTPDGLDPANPLSLEDDPVLQAIEAHEARPDDVYTKRVPPPPVAPPAPEPIPVPTPEPEPVVVGPTVEIKPAPTEEAPAATPAPQVPPPKLPEPPKPTPETIPVINQPIQQKEVEKPKKPLTPAEKIAEEIANNPATKAPFQFFIHQEVSKKTLIVVFAIIFVILVGIGVYVVLNTRA